MTRKYKTIGPDIPLGLIPPVPNQKLNWCEKIAISMALTTQPIPRPHSALNRLIWSVLGGVSVVIMAFIVAMWWVA